MLYAETAREARPSLDDGVGIRREDADFGIGEDEAVLVRFARRSTNNHCKRHGRSGS